VGAEWEFIAAKKSAKLALPWHHGSSFAFHALEHVMRIPANVTGHSGDRDRFAHGLHAGTGFVL
jgi:hypothetical protein